LAIGPLTEISHSVHVNLHRYVAFPGFEENAGVVIGIAKDLVANLKRFIDDEREMS
jgi:hypothetical protein